MEVMRLAWKTIHLQQVACIAFLLILFAQLQTTFPITNVEGLSDFLRSSFSGRFSRIRHIGKQHTLALDMQRTSWHIRNYEEV